MALHEKQAPKKGGDLTQPVLAAERFIHLFEQIKSYSEEQNATLAAAYYTLANQQDISGNKSRMHVNSAITLLKKINIENRKDNWNSQLAHAYFKRAEILEEKNSFALATVDYEEAIKVLEQPDSALMLSDEDRILLAQAAISIADLIVNEELETDKGKLSHPLFYINTALEHLAEVSETDDDIWATHAYAHQIAGIALSQYHFEEAKEAFRIALLMAFKSETVRICPLLADIYTCLGLLYEQQYQICPIELAPDYLLDHAMIYFGLSVLFNPNEIDEKEDDFFALESLFEMIYRVLDPYLYPLSHRVTCDLVDALIYAYMCVVDKVLPNEALEHQLNQSETLDTYAQHIYWLVIEAYCKKHPRAKRIEIISQNDKDLKLEMSDILKALQNIHSDNVHYLSEKKVPAEI